MENDCFIKNGAVFIKVSLDIKRDGNYLDVIAVDQDKNVVQNFGKFEVNTEESMTIYSVYLECKYRE